MTWSAECFTLLLTGLLLFKQENEKEKHGTQLSGPVRGQWKGNLSVYEAKSNFWNYTL